MKTKIIVLTGTLFLLLFISSGLHAQQTRTAFTGNTARNEAGKRSTEGNYTFRLYTAPDQTFGYDIIKDGKPVFHQFVLTFISKEGKRFFATKPQAEKAAMLAINKLRNEQQPLLSNEEIKKVMER